MCELSAPTDSALRDATDVNRHLASSGERAPAGRQCTLEACMTRQAGSPSYGGQAFVVAPAQSQVENLRHRIQTHTRSVEFDA